MREVITDPGSLGRAYRWGAGLLVAVLVGALLGVLPNTAAGAAEQAVAFVSDRDGDPEIFTVRPDGSGVAQLTSNLFWDTDPVWSPDGTKLAFSSNRDGDDDIYVMNRDGSGVINVTNTGSGRDVQPDWSPDGTKIVFVRDGDLHRVAATGGAATRWCGGVHLRGRRAGARSLSPNPSVAAATSMS